MSILDNEGHDPNGLGNRDTGWAKGYAAGRASLQGEIDWQRAEIASKSEQIGKLYRVCNERDVLRDNLSQALRQWRLYAELSEDRDLDAEESSEGELYRNLKRSLDAASGCVGRR